MTWGLSRQYEQESSGSAGDGIIETWGVCFYSKENYSSQVWSER